MGTQTSNLKGHILCKDGFECNITNIGNGYVMFHDMKVEGKPVLINGRPLPPTKMTVRDANIELKKNHGGIAETTPQKQEPDISYEEIEEDSYEESGPTEKDVTEYMEEFEQAEEIEDAEVRDVQEAENIAEEAEEEKESEEPEGSSEPDEPVVQETPEKEPEEPQSFIKDDSQLKRRYLSVMAQEYANTIRNEGGSVINGDVKIDGNLTAKGNIEIEGTVNGNVKTEGNVIITGSIEGDISADQVMLSGSTITGNIKTTDTAQIIDKAVLIGDIQAKNAIVEGNIKGNIICEESAKIKSNAVVYGNIKAKSIQIDEGVKTVGTVEVLGDDTSLDELFPGVSFKNDNKTGKKESTPKPIQDIVEAD